MSVLDYGFKLLDPEGSVSVDGAFSSLVLLCEGEVAMPEYVVQSPYGDNWNADYATQVMLPTPIPFGNPTFITYTPYDKGDVFGPASRASISRSFCDINVSRVYVEPTHWKKLRYPNPSGAYTAGEKRMKFQCFTPREFAAMPREDWGLEVYAPDGNVVFCSSEPYLRLIDVITLDYRDVLTHPNGVYAHKQASTEAYYALHASCPGNLEVWGTTDSDGNRHILNCRIGLLASTYSNSITIRWGAIGFRDITPSDYEPWQFDSNGFVTQNLPFEYLYDGTPGRTQPYLQTPTNGLGGPVDQWQFSVLVFDKAV